MFKLLGTETRPITLDLAKKMKEMKPSPTERPLFKKRVRILHAKVDEGVVISFLWIIATVDNVDYRMNGQHSSTMLCERENNFPEGLTAHIDRYQCDTMKDMALLFRQIDARWSNRTPADIAGAHQGTVPELHEVPPQAGKAAIDGIVFHQSAIEKTTKRLGDEKYELFADEQYHPFILWYGSTYEKDFKQFHPQHVVAAMYQTFTEDAEAAKRFWRGVESPPEFEVDAATSQLAQCLSDSLVQTKDIDLKPIQYYHGCLYAWRAFIENKKITEIKFDARKRSPRRKPLRDAKTADMFKNN